MEVEPSLHLLLGIFILSRCCGHRLCCRFKRWWWAMPLTRGRLLVLSPPWGQVWDSVPKSQLVSLSPVAQCCMAPDHQHAIESTRKTLGQQSHRQLTVFPHHLIPSGTLLSAARGPWPKGSLLYWVFKARGPAFFLSSDSLPETHVSIKSQSLDTFP